MRLQQFRITQTGSRNLAGLDVHIQSERWQAKAHHRLGRTEFEFDGRTYEVWYPSNSATKLVESSSNKVVACGDLYCIQAGDHRFDIGTVGNGFVLKCATLRIALFRSGTSYLSCSYRSRYESLTHILIYVGLSLSFG